MQIFIEPDASRAADLLVRITAAEIKRRPHLVLGLATGRTMEPVYARMVQLCGTGELDLSLVRTFNLDEYVGIGPEHPQSYRRFMNEKLFEHTNIDMRSTRVLDGMAPDLAAECERFEEEIRDCGGIDLQILGIGRTGHIGFNEPTSSLGSRTRVMRLTRQTIEQNAGLFGDADLVPRQVLTMGVGTILDSFRCLMLVTGCGKAEVAAKAIEGPITAMVSASAIQLHPRCTVILDEAAAADLQFADYYRSAGGENGQLCL